MIDPAGLLADTLRRINGEFELDDLLRALLGRVIEATGASRALVVAWTPENPTPVMRGEIGAPAPFGPGEEVATTTGIMDLATRSGRIVWTEDAAKDERFREVAQRSGLHVRRLGAVPVFGRGRPTGAILYYGDIPGALTRPAAELLAEAAHLSAMALEVSALREQRTHDAATGLLTHRTLLARMNEELVRATRHGRPFSLLRFAGADAQTVRSLLRPGDLLAAVEGGLLALLPETRRDDAVALGSRIGGQFGVASAPEDAVEAETLLLALDAPVRANGGGHPAQPALATREGKSLRGILMAAFARDLELPTQLDLAAAAIAGALQAEGGFLAIQDAGKEWVFSAGASDDVRSMLRTSAQRGQTLRDGEAVALPFAGGAAWIRRARIGEYEEQMLRALGEAVATQVSESVTMQRRREELRAREVELTRAVEDLRRKYDFSAIVGTGPALTQVLQIVARAAETDAPVLITGESGTGKELIARAVHANSSRRRSLFTVLNCAAVPPSLMESELFGHTKGAFTSAAAERKGLFETAHRGTVFLDEVAEIPVEVQAKLLRAIQFGEIQRVGSDDRVQVDVRVVAATNRDLTEDVRRKRFREDLFYRINVFRVHVPPLREHAEDIPALIEHFCDRFAKEFRRDRVRPDPAVVDVLSRYPFPGNVRELENVLLRAIAMSVGSVVTMKDLPPEILGGAPSLPFAQPRTAQELDALKEKIVKEAQDRLEIAFLRHILAEARGNVSEAARKAGLHRTHLHRLISRHDVNPDDFK